MVDAHVHLNTYGGSARGLEAQLGTLLETMDRHDVAQAVVITSYTESEHRPGVRDIVARLQDEPRLVVVEGLSFEGGKARFEPREVEARLEADEIRGLKLYPGYQPFYPHDPACDPVFELAARYEVPVLVHTGDTHRPDALLKYAHPLELDETAVRHPDAMIVMCHAGNPWLVDAAQVLWKNANVHADLSGLVTEEAMRRWEAWMVERLDAFLRYVGDPSRILFGSDWPVTSMALSLRFVDALELTPGEKDRVLRENARALFALP